MSDDVETLPNGLPAEPVDVLPVVLPVDEIRFQLAELAAGVDTINLRLGCVDGGIEKRVAGIELQLHVLIEMLGPAAELLAIMGQLAGAPAGAGGLVLPPPPFSG